MKCATCKDAILFLVFNRPESTRRVFEAIRAARPKMLFVVADGARIERDGEKEKCQHVHQIIDSIDWPCELIRNYSEVNMGCGKRVSSGISWVFEQVDRAIILEDDCLPHLSFFDYCTELLNRYAEEPRVMHIGGVNFQQGRRWGKESYFFSKYAHVWGWATWRRAWKHYDFHMGALNDFMQRGGLDRVSCDLIERDYWREQFEKTKRREIDTWDYQWVLSCWANEGVAAYPNVNLVSNIGFGPEATHTTGESPQMNVPTRDIGEISHPAAVEKNLQADEHIFNSTFGGAGLRSNRSISERIRRKIKRLSGVLKR